MRWAIHKELAALVGSTECDHAGLRYEVYAPVSRDDGKLAGGETVVEGWLDSFENIRVPTGYREYIERLRRAHTGAGDWVAEATTEARLLVGHGLPAPTEVGIALHRTWGVPYIPGSSLKGLLSHFLYATGEFADTHKTIFGTAAMAPGEPSTRGLLTVHDALWLPEGADRLPLARDVLTPHQGEYYKDGSQFPNDWTSPNPVSFLSVKPGVSFVFFLHYAGGPVAFDVLQQQFARALAIWGAGGKTAAGYGRFSELVDKPPPPARIRALEELEAFINAAKAGGKSVKAIWRELRGSWGARLRDVPAEPLIRLQRKKLKGKGITEEFKRWLAQLHGEGEGEDE